MDTFNGLNQGRMNMNFCTQFWSEYASLPTAFSWVVTGAVVGLQGKSGYEWAEDAIPICLVMAATWQFIGTTIGGYQLVNANGNEKFWKNKEKWETVQYFAKQGVKATKYGWTQDCFCLAKTHCLAKTGEIGSDISLFEMIYPIQKKFLDTTTNYDSVHTTKIAQKKYNLERSTAQNTHWEMLKQDYFENERHDGKLTVKPQYTNLFITEQPVENETDRNAWRQSVCLCGCTFQMLLVIIALFSGIYSYFSVAQDIDTEVAVQVGLDVLTDVSVSAWLGFIIFNLVVLVYYWRACWDSLISGFRGLISMLCICCASPKNQNLETVFKPTWDSQGKTVYPKNEVMLFESDTFKVRNKQDILDQDRCIETSDISVSNSNFNDGRCRKQRIYHQFKYSI